MGIYRKQVVIFLVTKISYIEKSESSVGTRVSNENSDHSN